MTRLAIITTHPIQYNAPWFRLLAQRGIVHPKVFYTWSQVEHQEKFDPGFGKVIEWDIPLLEGYDFSFVKNVSKRPGSKTYSGIDNPTLIRELTAWQPDAILIFGWKFKSHLQVMRHFYNRIPILFRGDSTALQDSSSIKGRIRNLILRRVYKRTDYVLFVGKENEKYFRKAGISDHQLVFAPHAVDNERFRPTDQSIAEGRRLRLSLGIMGDEIVFLSAGKFEPVKNPGLLVDAAQELTGHGGKIHFVFAGNGPLENELKKSGSANVHFLGFQNQASMPALYQLCDVFVLPSRSETWGLAVNEAMAAGKPVLASDSCGCTPDLIIEKVTGITFRNNDKISLLEKLTWFINQQKKLPEMGEAAKEHIQKYSFGEIVQSIESLMARIK